MERDSEVAADGDGNLVVKTDLASILRGIQKDLSSGFAALREAMSTKADKTDVVHLEARLDEHTRQIDQLNAWKSFVKDRTEQTFTRRQKFWAGLGVFAVVTATIAGPIIAVLITSK